MNSPGLVLPASLFQQTEQQQSPKCNDLKIKCSCVGDMSRPLGNAIKEASRGVKSQENLTDIGSLKQCSDDLGQLSRHSSDGNYSAGLASKSSNTDEPMKRTSKKKRKKGKLNKKQFQNNVALKTDLASPTSTTTPIGLEDSSFMTGPTERNQHREGVCYQLLKEVIDCYACNEVASRCDNAHSQSTLDPEGSPHVSKTDDSECLSRSNGETSEVVVLQDSTSDFCKVDNINSTQLVRKHDKDVTFPGFVVISATGWENVDSCEEKSSSNAHYQDTCGVIGSQILPEDTCCRSMEASENRSDATNFGTKRSNTSQNKVNAHFSDIRNERNIKSPHMRSQSVNHLAHCISSMKMSMDVQEFSKDGSIEENNSSNQYFKASDDPAIVTNQDVEHDEGKAHTLIDASQLPSQINNHKRIGKENAGYIWQKTRTNIGSIQAHGRRRSNCYKMCTDADTARRTSHLSRHNSFAGDGLLPRPQSSYTNMDGFQQRAKKLGTSDQERRISHGQVLIESPKWAFPQNLNVGCGQNMSISGDDGSMGSMAWENLKDKVNQPFKQDNVIHYRRGFWVSKANLCKPRTKTNIVYRDFLEIPRTISHHRSDIAGKRSSHGNHHNKFDFSEECEFVPSFPAFSSNGQLHGPWTRTSSHQKLLHEIQPHAATRVPISEDVLGECYHAFLDNENKSPTCVEFELHYDNSSKECISSSVSSQKWIPVGKKDPLMFKSSMVADASNSKKLKFHQKTDSVAICDETSVVDVSKNMNDDLISGRQGRSLWEGKTDHNASGADSKNLPIYVGSDLTTQTLYDAYRFQLASERIQLATGRPIAEFEKLLYSASPVIISSVPQYHEDNGRDQPIPISFNKFQNMDVLLRDVWRWYERPGNYGLEIKAEEPQNSKGLETNVVSFHAHFVPSLSAVQLFVNSQHSSTGSSPGNKTSDVSQKGETEPCALSSLSQNQLCPELAEQTFVSDLFHSRERHMKPFHFATSDRDDSCNSLYASSFSDDSEVVFEYFEKEPPQQRKPFYTKVKELMEIGSSNPSVFGDPSKLGNMNLQDLHPASWFSVAWYPIYRIPEGSFRASFLTYHSLGHLVLRRIKLDSLENTAFCAVFPVLGMQSYNAQQGECWFRPKKSAGSVLIDGTFFDSSEILKERLRTLEETSALFARGHVRKDQIRTPNRQPDYEFFLSRKQ